MSSLLKKLPQTRSAWLVTLFCFGLAMISYFAPRYIPALKDIGLSPLAIALFLGFIFAHIIPFSIYTRIESDYAFTKGTILRVGVALYGLRLSFQQIEKLGLGAIIIDMCVITMILTIAWTVGRRLLKLDDDTALLIGMGSAVCGAAAVLATDSITKSDSEKVTVAIATVVIFGTILMFVEALIYHLFPNLLGGISGFGIYIGSTVHEVAQVVASASTASSNATLSDTAVLTKMLRVLMLVPLLIGITIWKTRKQDAINAANGTLSKEKRGPIKLPVFAIMFLVFVVVNSFNIIPEPYRGWILTLDTILLSMAMGALGATTHVRIVKKAGIRPLILGIILFFCLLVLGGGINWIVHSLPSIIS